MSNVNFDAVHNFVSNRFANTPVAWDPFPYIYISSVFPPALFAQMRAHMPPKSNLKCAADVFKHHEPYKDRFVLRFSNDEDLQALPPNDRDFWIAFRQWLYSTEFATMVLGIFHAQMALRFPNTHFDINTDFGCNGMLARDYTNYALGPHTDHPRKLFTLLFYLPADDAFRHLGTSMYVPENPDFASDGDEGHYPYTGFNLHKVAGYKPNSMFGFFKTSHSFHGVEPITESNVQRDLLIYNFSSRELIGNLDLNCKK